MRRPGFIILHVEDDPDDVLLTHDAFAEAGRCAELIVASDGEEALSYIQGRDKFADRKSFPLPSLILLDLKLPRKSGLEVLEWLREKSSSPCIPVVILTSSENGGDIQRAYELGVNSYLIKPVDFHALQNLALIIADYWIALNRGPEPGLNFPNR